MPPQLKPAPAPKAPTQTVKAPTKFSIQTGITRNGFKLGIYGPEGIGKSTLASLCPDALFADIEGSMADIDCKKVPELSTDYNWTLLREWVQSLSNCIAGIDSMTRAEDWAMAHVIKTKKSNDGVAASDSLEDFKYGAGATFVVDEFRKLIGDIDSARRRNVSFIMVAHARVNRFKNPDGSDFVRYEPRLVDTPKVSNMLQWVQFLDHLAFINLDMAVTKGKVAGGGSRTIYLDSSPSRISKCRGISSDPIIFTEGNTELWTRLGL
jgi:hypothetical protein